MTADHPMRPFMPADTVRVQDLFAQSIEELTQEEYDEDQRLAWMSGAADGRAFARRLMQNVTLLVEREGELLGFASLKENTVVDFLYVHPYAVGEGVATTLMDALEKLARARGAKELTADVSDTAYDVFLARGFEPVQRNNIPIGDVWVPNTTMRKSLEASEKKDPAR